MRNSLVFLVILVVTLSPRAWSSSELNEKPVSIIFDTDIGSDCDDAGALAVLHALADLGEVDIVGVIFSSGRNRYGVGACDAINTWYGRGDLPLGQYQPNDVGDPRNTYSRDIAENTGRYRHDVIDKGPELIQAYKSMLKSRPDGTVTIVTVGHAHGLVHLLRDQEGRRLIERKVDRWIAMAGFHDKPTSEWNLTANGMAAYRSELLEKWPKEALFSPWGADVKTGHRLLPKTHEDNPVREAYRTWVKNALETGRSSWDQIAVLSAVRPQYFRIESVGRADEDGNKCFWNKKTDNPKHHRVHLKITRDEMAAIIEGLMAATPKARETR